MDPNLADIELENRSLVTMSCFFCQSTDPKLKSEIEVEVGKEDGDGSRTSLDFIELVPLPLVALKSICGYLNVSIKSDGYSYDNDNDSTVFLCGECAKVQNKLSELIQMGEAIEMKIGYWLELLQRQLKTDDNFQGEGEETQAGASDLLRKAIKLKCSSKTSSNKIRFHPIIPVERAQQPAVEPNPTPNLSDMDMDIDTVDPSGSPSWSTSSSSGDSAPASPSSPNCFQEDDDDGLIKSDPELDDEDETYEPESEEEDSDQNRLTVNIKSQNPERKSSSFGRWKGPIKCKLCGSSFSGRQSFCLHRKTEHKEVWKRTTKLKKRTRLDVPLKCRLCDEEFVGQSNLDSHDETVHRAPEADGGDPSAPKWKCHWTGCDKLFAVKKSLYYHIQIKHKQKFHECQRCDKKFASLASYKNHMLLITCTEPKEHCQICGKGFRSKDGLSRHRRQEHRNKSKRKQDKYSCAQCGKTYSFLNSYNSHMRWHTNQNEIIIYPCGVDNCERTFKNRWNLKVHLKKAHGVELPNCSSEVPPPPLNDDANEKLECTRCKKCFKSLNGLQIHMLLRRCQLELEGKRPEGKHVCGICNKRLANVSSLNTHIRSVHQKEKMNQNRYKYLYRCEEEHCDKVYKDTTALRRHHVVAHGIPTTIAGKYIRISREQKLEAGST